MTQTQLAAKRTECTMSQRERRSYRLRRIESIKREARSRSAWLAELGKTQQDAATALDARHQQAMESRRTQAAMFSPTPAGVIGRVKALFQRRTP